MPIVDQSPTFAGNISAAEQIPLDELLDWPMPGPLNWGWRPMKSPLGNWINGRWKLSTVFKPQKNAEWE